MASANLPCPKPGHHLEAHRVRRPSNFISVALLLLFYSSDTILLIILHVGPLSSLLIPSETADVHGCCKTTIADHTAKKKHQTDTFNCEQIANK